MKSDIGLNDFRLALALEVAEAIGAQVQKERCPDCSHPLMMKEEQGISHCWFCTVDRIAAQRGRTALTKARLAARGIIIHEDLHPAPVANQWNAMPEDWHPLAL